MTPARLFWGVFFVALGTILILILAGVDTSLLGAVRWGWPLLLVLLGGAMLFKHAIARSVLLSVSAFVIALIVGESLRWIALGSAENAEQAARKDLAILMETEAERASFDLSASMGRYRVHGAAGGLVEAQIHGDTTRYTLTRIDGDGEPGVRLQKEGKRLTFLPWQSPADDVELRLNRAPLWTIRVKARAAQMHLDLSTLRLSEMSLDASASVITVVLPVPDVITVVPPVPEETISLDVDGFAVSLHIVVPAGTGVEVESRGLLLRQNLGALERIGRRIHRSPNFEASSRKVVVNSRCRLASLRVSEGS